MSAKRNLLQRVGASAAAIALATSMAAPGLAVAADVPAATSKDETVHVHLSADGQVVKTEVSTVLKNGSQSAQVLDRSTLTDVKGDDGATFDGPADEMVWNAGGKDVSYTGIAAAETPVAVSVSYTLDGQLVSADQLAGKSGRVTIRFDYANRSETTASVRGTTQTIYTPFTCVTALMYDSESFKNVQIENGKVVEDGSDAIVLGYAMPGLKQSLGSLARDADIPEHFSLTADVTDFELKSSMTIATAGVMSDFDADGLGLGNLDDASLLGDAMSELIVGSGALTDGLDQLKEGIGKVGNGAGELVSGASALQGGLYALMHGTDTTPGLDAASAGAAQLASALDQVSAAAGQLADEQAGLPAAAGALSQAAAVDPQLFEAAKASLATYQETMAESDYQTLAAALEAASLVSTTVTAVSPGVSSAAEGSRALDASLAQIALQADSLPSGLAAAYGAVEALYAGSSELVAGASQLSSATDQLESGAAAAAQGSSTLTQGLAAFNDEGVSKLVETLQNDYGGMLDRMHALSGAAKSYDNFGGIAPGTTGSVRFVFETDAIEKA